MRIAYIGLKGLPETYSGVETHVHEVGTRLVRRGHEVTAYVRLQYTPRHVQDDDGIRLLHLPTIKTKHLDATVHSFLAAMHAIKMNYDIVHFHTVGPAGFAWLPRLSRARVVTTVHRFDYLSGKWGRFARTCMQAAEQLGLRMSHRAIAVAPFLQAHYEAQGHKVEYIPNGVTLPSPGIGTAGVKNLGLIPNQYILFLGRLVPEKRPDWAIRAFQQIRAGTIRLVITGDSSATDQYVCDLKALAQPTADRILFTGAVYGSLKDELLANARAFVLPSALEGLPITLLEAMSHGTPCLVSDIPPHRDVIRDGKNGFLHHAAEFDHLCECLNSLIHAAPSALARIGKAAKATVVEGYNWEKIVDQIEQLYETVLCPARPAQYADARAIAADRSTEES
jgi:glycosyltransferase involved in cell wall biosynthesis